MRFDAYAGTLRGVEIQVAAAAIAQGVGGQIKHGQARRRYGEVLDVEVGGRQAAWVGLDRGNGTAYFEGKGETTPDLVGVVRRQFPEHTAARLDVCEDFDEAGAFEQLVDLTRRHKGDRVQGAFIRLPDDPEQGRTWQAGVRGGVAMARVYEAGKMRDRLHYGRPNWVRFELEIRPHYAREKAAAAGMSPVEVCGLAAWTQRVAAVIARVPVPRFEPEARVTSRDRTTVYLARAFRRHWEEMLADHGDWVCVGREMAAVWDEDDQAAEAIRGAVGRRG